MYLKQDINIVAFLKKVGQCEGDVLLRMKGTDVLNLRSTLCQYVFAVAATHKDLIEAAEVICERESDVYLIEDFLSIVK